MIADGTPLVVVSKRLGHAQVSTTANIYSHVIQSADEKAAKVGDKFADAVAPSPVETKKRKAVQTTNKPQNAKTAYPTGGFVFP
jgi:hypothetical protein